MSTPVAQLENVSFAYEELPILEGVDFVVEPGDLICMVGPNGGGKTTLLKILLGLLRPTSGNVRLFGQPPVHARGRVGYMPQHLHFDPLFPVTVLDTVLMGRLGRPGLRGWFGWYDAADRRAARDALAEVEMEAYAARPLAALSGGQRQRVLIARALCCQPELLLLDEPTANVDTRGEARLVEILRELGRRMTIMMVSHDLGFVADLVEKVVCVNRRVAVHPASEVSGELIQDIYGGDLRMVRHDQHYDRPEARDG